jgi:hypothetical protein
MYRILIQITPNMSIHEDSVVVPCTACMTIDSPAGARWNTGLEQVQFGLLEGKFTAACISDGISPTLHSYACSTGSILC